MKRLIIHIGYPKTATKSLQINVFSNLYHKGAIEYLNHIGTQNKDLGNYIIRNIFEYSIGFTEVFPTTELETLNGINKALTIFSNESLAHVSSISLSPEKKIASPENIERLYKLFSPYFDTIDVVMTIRNQETMIHSYYTQEYYNIIHKAEGFKDIGLWLQNSFGESVQNEKLLFNYFEMYQTVKKLFGHKHTHVLIYEDSIHNKQQFFSQWGHILGIDQNEVSNLFNKKTQNVTAKKLDNTRYTDKQTLSSKLSVISNRLYLPVSVKHFVKSIIPQKLLNRKTGKDFAVRGFTEDEKSLIKKRYADSNRFLCEELQIGLDKFESYSYPI